MGFREHETPTSGSGSQENENEPDMELDFHIEFPKPDYDSSVKNGIVESNGNGIKSNGDSSSSSKYENIWPVPGYENKDKDTKDPEKEVVVVLLGWAGSQHKNLAKYSDIYLKRGCIALRYIAPVNALFVQASKLPVLANRLVRLLQDLQLDGHPIIFHVFSNGGSFTYSYILREIALTKDKLDLDLRGTIFDSAPSPRNLGKCFKAVSSIFDNLKWFRFVIASMVVIAIAMQVFWFHMKSAVQLCYYGEPISPLDPKKRHPEGIPLTDWLARICKMKNHNYLFIYSDLDDLIPWEQVEEIADITASHGNYVVKKKFIGSEHVQHYRKFPEEYVQIVTDFIRHTMKSDNKKNRTVVWEGR